MLYVYVIYVYVIYAYVIYVYIIYVYIIYMYIMIPGAKGLNPHELAHRWVKDLGSWAFDPNII